MAAASGLIEPKADRNKNRLDILNEAFVLIFTYHLYPLTEYMTDAETRDYVGTSLVIVAVTNIAINLGLIFFNSMCAGIRKLKLWYLSR